MENRFILISNDDFIWIILINYEVFMNTQRCKEVLSSLKQWCIGNGTIPCKWEVEYKEALTFCLTLIDSVDKAELGERNTHKCDISGCEECVIAFYENGVYDKTSLVIAKRDIEIRELKNNGLFIYDQLKDAQSRIVEQDEMLKDYESGNVWNAESVIEINKLKQRIAELKK